MQEPKVSFYGIIIFLLAAIFYLYEFALQISPGVMTEALMHDLDVGAWGLSLISSFYYYAYAPMQLPAGVLYDRFGPRLLLGLAVALCGLGTLFFSFTQQLAFAGIGRMLMGAGSAFSFVGTLVLITRWFPVKYFAFLVGLTQFMGSAGAIIGEGALAETTDIFGWRHTLLGLGIFGIVLALLIWIIVKDWPTKKAQQLHERHQQHILHDLKQVLGQSQTWITAFYAFLVWAPITVFAALWGVPYMSKLYNITNAQAGTAVSVIWLGVALSCPLLGWWSDKSQCRKLPMLSCALVGVISLLAIVYLPMSLHACYLALFGFGFAAAGQSVSFGVVRDNNKTQVVGTAIGFNNMIIVTGGAILQPLVGWILHANWLGGMVKGVPSYSIGNYQHALIALPVCYLLALVVAIVWLKESYTKPE